MNDSSGEPKWLNRFLNVKINGEIILCPFQIDDNWLGQRIKVINSDLTTSDA